VYGGTGAPTTRSTIDVVSNQYAFVQMRYITIPKALTPDPYRPLASDRRLQYNWLQSDTTDSLSSITLTLSGPGGSTAVMRNGTSQFTFTGLTNGSNYNASIYGTNILGESGPIENYTVSQPGFIPSEPRNVTFTKQDDNRLYIEWLPPANTGGSAVNWYIIRSSNYYYNFVNGREYYEEGIEGYKTSHLTEPILPGTYTFEFCAINFVGYSYIVSSDPITFT
jgi:hypothetical protein